jgi:hypothetical protein
MVLCKVEDTMRTSILNRFFTPVLTPFLESRALALMIVGCAVTQTLLVFFGLPSWQCPIRAATGVPCPGCGLSSAMVLLFRGRWLESLERHAFAPIFLLAFVLLGVASVLPAAWHQKIVNVMSRAERQTGFAVIVLLALVGYWGIRLVLQV